VISHLPLVIGLGSNHGDDQAGWFVVDRLRELGYPDTSLYRATHPADIFDVAVKDRQLIICDACLAENSPCKINRLTWPTDQLLEHQTSGTHDLSLRQVLSVGQQLQCFPETIDIWTIDGCSWTSGAPVAHKIQVAAAEVAKRIWEAAHHA